MELPTDLAGIVRVSFDAGDWKLTLGRELEAVGFKFDWNKIV
jgi:hypothetical protein